MIMDCSHTNVVSANKKPCEDGRLRGGSRIRMCARQNESQST